MDRFREIETYVAVVEAGSFVKAAERLRISKSVASRIISDLEERLGGRLLQRTTRQLSLTEAGEAYYQRCLQIIDELQEADGVVSMHSSNAVGLLKVNAPLTFGTLHLARYWGEFLHRNPQLNLDITLMDRFVDLVSEGFDMAIRVSTQLQTSSLITRKLASSRVVLCASPEYLEKNGIPKTPEEMAGHDFVGYSYWLAGNNLKLSSEDRVEGIKIHPRLRVNNGDTCRAAALDGLGIIFQPTFIVGEDLKTGSLIEILPEWHSEEAGIYAVYPVRKHLSGKVRALVDYLVEVFKDAPWNSGV